MTLGQLQFWIIAILRTMFGLSPGTGGGGGSYTLTGPILIGDGSVSAPSYAFSSTPGTGYYSLGSGYMAFASGGVNQFSIGPSVFQITKDQPVSWSSTSDSQGTSDLKLFRDAANTLAQRNGVNAQTFRVYNTYTDASNYERAIVQWSSNILDIGVEVAGSGSLRNLRLTGAAINIVTAVGLNWQFRSDGVFLAVGNFSLWIGNSALATTATAGFLGVSSCAGPPTGVPASVPTGQIPLVYDSTNHILYAYEGAAWKKPMASLVTGNVTWQ